MPQAPERDAIRSGYDRWASVYDDDGNPLLALEEPDVPAAIGDLRGMSVLEVVGWPMLVVLALEA